MANAAWQLTGETETERAERFLRRHCTVHDLIHAGAEILGVVIQDEYTHDVVARLPQDAGALLVVFDST